jgi:hypothetical protein
MPDETHDSKRPCIRASKASAAGGNDMAEGLRQVQRYDSQLDLGARQNAIIDCLIGPHCFSVRSQYEQQISHYYQAMREAERLMLPLKLQLAAQFPGECARFPPWPVGRTHAPVPDDEDDGWGQVVRQSKVPGFLRLKVELDHLWFKYREAQEAMWDLRKMNDSLCRAFALKPPPQ